LNCVPAISRDAAEKYEALNRTTSGSKRFEAVKSS
jgi:hypothetical protein